MTWLARLKKSAAPPDTHPAKPTKPPFAGFAGTPAALSENSRVAAHAANDPAHHQDFNHEAFDERAAIMQFDGGMSRTDAEALAAAGMVCDVDRHCWPHTAAMNTAEIDTFTARLHLFTRHGLDYAEAERLVDGLVARDRDQDDRRLCLECFHLRGCSTSWTCNQWRRAGLAVSSLPADVVRLAQRCDNFKESTL